jgi:hypothetical protein
MDTNGTNTNGTKWLGRKTWRRLLELHASGRISRDQFRQLKQTLARDRGSPPPPRPSPALRVVPGGGRAPAPARRYLLPSSKEVA